MKKLSKGALAMVLVGSVTFSVTNALLAEHPINRIVKAITLHNSADQKIAENLNQAKKLVKDQKPITEAKDVKIMPSQEAPKSENNNDIARSVNKQNIKKISKRTLPTPAKVYTTTTTTHSATTIAASRTKVSKPMTTIPVNASENTTTSTPTTTTTTTNHGKIVSQDVKEKALSHRDKKENNGKKL